MRATGLVYAFVLLTTAVRGGAAAVSRELHRAGPPAATPHLVLLAEGYTASEQDSFFSDASRVVGEAFLRESAAMRDVAPLLSIAAVFVTSRHRGIPRGSAADTAFQLYREGEEIRSILPSSASYDIARTTCSHAAPRCDFVVILCNDPFYGGLGDQVIIATASPTSGAIALRHELAHVMADVGEEYDAGGDYSGGNFGTESRWCRDDERPKEVSNKDAPRQLWPCLPWRHFTEPACAPPLPSPTGAAAADVKELQKQAQQRLWGGPQGEGGLRGDAPCASPAPPPPTAASMLHASWPWHHMTEPYRVALATPPRGHVHFLVSFSVAGLPPGGKLVMEWNGRPVATPARRTQDRQFLDVHMRSSVPGVLPSLRLALHPAANTAHQEVAKCVVGHVYVYSSPAPFDQRNRVAAFPVFNADRRVVGFRPTNGHSLLRNMSSTALCPVTKELLVRRRLGYGDLSRKSIAAVAAAQAAALHAGPASALHRTANARRSSEPSHRLAALLHNATLSFSCGDGDKAGPLLPLATVPGPAPVQRSAKQPHVDAAVPWAHSRVPWPQAAVTAMRKCDPASRRLWVHLHGSPLLLGAEPPHGKAKPSKGSAPASIQTIRWWTHTARSNASAAEKTATSTTTQLSAFNNARRASVAAVPESQVCVTVMAALCHQSVRVACPAHEEALTVCLAAAQPVEADSSPAPATEGTPTSRWVAVILFVVVAGTYAVPVWRYFRRRKRKV